MYDWSAHMDMQALLKAGLTKAAVAERLGVSRRTVTRWQTETEPKPRPRKPRIQKLDPYKDIIRTRLQAYPELTVQRLFEEVRAAGYDGGYGQVRTYVSAVRPTSEPAPVVRFETPPGHQGQVDFGTFRTAWGMRYALVVVLGYSRLLWLSFYASQTMATVMTGLERAFTTFGGVPTELLFDQMKAVVTSDGREVGGTLVLNEEFQRFAAHWGFRVRACRPYRAQTKGKVERQIRYVRQSFYYGRTFISDDDLNTQAHRWLQDVANRRKCSAIGEAPQVRFERDEASTLGPLAPRPYRPVAASPPAAKPVVARIEVARRDLVEYDEMTR